MTSALDVIEKGIFSACEVTLQISSTEERVYQCIESFRLLPGRRLTALAKSGTKKYVVKIFANTRRAMNDYQAEIKGFEILHNASYDVPARIYYGPADNGVKLIVYQYVARARTLSEIFAYKHKSKLPKPHLKRLIELFVQLRRDNLVHEDPHLDNFLLKGDDIYVLDMGAVRKVRNEHLIDRNMALAVAQFPRSLHVEEPWLDHYLAELQNTDESLRGELVQLIRKQQDWRENHVLKKIYRECTAFHVRSTIFGRMVFDRNFLHGEMMNRLSDPEHIFDHDDVTLLKDGNSSTVGLVPIDGRQYVVKRYNVKNMRHRMKMIWRESRASRSWRNAHCLILRGIRTARPVAIVECLKGRLKGVSLFVTEYVPGTNSAEFFLQKHVIGKIKNQVAVKMLDMICELERESLVHGDLKSTNFIISEGEPVLVDLDAMRVEKSRRKLEKGIAKDRSRFKANWLENPEAKVIFDLLMEADRN